MEISPKYDLVPYVHSDVGVLPYSAKTQILSPGSNLTHLKQQNRLQHRTLYPNPEDYEIIKETYNFQRNIQHSKINRIGSQINIYV